jgi:hypothetical protein
MSLAKVRYKDILDLQRFLQNLSIALLSLTLNLTILLLHLESVVEILSCGVSSSQWITFISNGWASGGG